jgi:hypothetical protein
MMEEGWFSYNLLIATDIVLPQIEGKLKRNLWSAGGRNAARDRGGMNIQHPMPGVSQARRAGIFVKRNQK